MDRNDKSSSSKQRAKAISNSSSRSGSTSAAASKSKSRGPAPKTDSGTTQAASASNRKTSTTNSTSSRARASKQNKSLPNNNDLELAGAQLGSSEALGCGTSSSGSGSSSRKGSGCLDKLELNAQSGKGSTRSTATIASDQVEQETDIDDSQAFMTPTASSGGDGDKLQLPKGWEQHSDASGLYYWHVATGLIQRDRPLCEPQTGGTRGEEAIIFCNDDEEINQANLKPSSADLSACGDYSPGDASSDDNGAALTVDDSSESTFLVYPLGCCKLDETELNSTASTKVIQKCILRLSMGATSRSASNGNNKQTMTTTCWGIDSSQAIVMKLFDDHIQFVDFKSQLLLRSQPIQTIRSWAVDDDNNFAFVIEDGSLESDQTSSNFCNNNDGGEDEFALLGLREPNLVCYVFRSVDDDDDMSCRVSRKLNAEITRYREQMSARIERSTRIQQMRSTGNNVFDDSQDIEGQLVQQQLDKLEVEAQQQQERECEEDENDEEQNDGELTLRVKYIGRSLVPRPTGIDVLNLAIDRCFSPEDDQQPASPATNSDVVQVDEEQLEKPAARPTRASNRLVEAKLHVSPSSVIIENEKTGEIMVECRIRYLTFIGISKRDIRWCGFIMQNSTTKSFEAHALECLPTAGQACEAIQASCVKMYEKVVKGSRNQQEPETLSLMPSKSRIRDTLAKTLSRIRIGH